MRESSYRQYSGTVCLRVYKRQGSLAVGTILASLSVRTTAGLLRVGGRDLGVLDTSGESPALLFVLVVLVSEAEETAEETAEVTRTKVTYEACFQKVHAVVCVCQVRETSTN